MRRQFLLAAGLLCGAAPLKAEPLFGTPGMWPVLFDVVRTSAARGSGTGGSLLGGATVVTGCTSKFLIANASGILDCDAGMIADTSGAGNGSLTYRDTTLAAGSDTAGFFVLSGTFTQTTSGSVINGSQRNYTTVGSAAVVQRGERVNLAAGYTGASLTTALAAFNTVAGTATDAFSPNGNEGIRATSTATTTGFNVGVVGFASGGDKSFGALFRSTTSKSNATNVGVAAYAIQASGTPVVVAGYFALRSAEGTPTSSAINVDNGAVAVPVLFAQDNGAAAPSSGATATFTVTDGANVQFGNGVLTSATMTAETQGLLKTVVSSYTWTNAQVAALAGTAGDITVATLPAKTRIVNAYIVITGAAAGPTTVTVSLGDAVGGTPFINYIVASDAKAAANTVYGDAAAERGTGIDVEFYNIPSYTATTLVTAHFISTGANLSTTTGSTGRVILETVLLP